jgi:hypothetical protein
MEGEKRDAGVSRKPNERSMQELFAWMIGFNLDQSSDFITLCGHSWVVNSAPKILTTSRGERRWSNFTTA